MTVPTGRSRSNELTLRDLLARQHSLITTAQLETIGVSASAASKRVRRGELERVFPHVYRSTLVIPTFAQYALAAVLWGGPGALASHVTAVRLYGSTECDTSELHLWVPPERRPRSPFVIVHRGVVAANDHRIRNRVPARPAPL